MSDSITITGNIATPPEHKRTPAGVAITTFRVASSQRRYDRASASWVDAGTNWYTVSTFRSLADHAFASLRKGDRVLLTGRLRLRQWDTGVKQGTTAEIDAEAIGHDLLWGTTRFEKDAPPSVEAPAAVEPADDWAPSGEGVDAVPDAPPVEWSAIADPAEDAEFASTTATPF